MPISQDKTLEELFKFRLAQLKSDIDYATSTMSQLSRVIDYGLVALVFTFVMSRPENKPLVLQHCPWMVLLAAILGSLAIICELVQNVLVEQVARREVHRLTCNLQKANLVVTSAADFLQKEACFATWARRKLFWMKIIFTAIGAGFVFVGIVFELTNAQGFCF
jgi:hypothetical protein